MFQFTFSSHLAVCGALITNSACRQRPEAGPRFLQQPQKAGADG